MAVLKNLITLGDARVIGNTRLFNNLTTDAGFIKFNDASDNKVWNTNGGIVDLTSTLTSYLPLTGGTMSGNIAMGSYKITGLGSPTSDSDAATKEYVDDLVVNATHYIGDFNAATGVITGGGTLTSVAEKIGDVYTVSTAGTYCDTALEVGDSIIFKRAVAANTAPVASDITFVEGTTSVSSGSENLDWNTSVTLATVEGTAIKSKLPQYIPAWRLIGGIDGGGINSLMTNNTAIAINPASNGLGYNTKVGTTVTGKTGAQARVFIKRGNIEFEFCNSDGYISQSALERLFDGKNNTYIMLTRPSNYLTSDGLSEYNYSSEKSYSVGDFCRYTTASITSSGVSDYAWYRCIQAGTGNTPSGVVQQDNSYWEYISAIGTSYYSSINPSKLQSVRLRIYLTNSVQNENGVSIYWRVYSQHPDKLEVVKIKEDGTVNGTSGQIDIYNKTISSVYLGGIGSSNTENNNKIIDFVFSEFRSNVTNMWGCVPTQIAFTGGVGSFEGTLVNRGGGTDASMYGNFLPYKTNTLTLGSSNYKWDRIYVNKINETTIPSNPVFTDTDTKVRQTVTNSGNSSWRPLILGYSYNDDTTFTPTTVTDVTFASHLAKFKPDTGLLAIGGLYKMNTNGTVATGSNNDVFNTNGEITSLGNYATVESTYGTTGSIVNGVSFSNCIARGDLGCVGFDNTPCTVKLYEAPTGEDYPSAPTLTIDKNHATFGNSFKKGSLYSTIHTCTSGSKLKIIIESTHYIKAAGIYFSTEGNTIQYTSTIQNITKSEYLSTYGSWHILSCMDKTPTSVTIELNTTNVNCQIKFYGIRTYIIEPNLRFPGISNTADDANNIYGGDPGSIPYQNGTTSTTFLTGLSSNNGNVLTYDYTNRKPYWNKLYEANLSWGGQDIADGYAPIDAALNPLLSANRFAGIKAQGVTVEYYNVSNSTWTDYGLTDGEKTKIFTTSQDLYIVGPSEDISDVSLDNKLRITLEPSACSVYTDLNKLHIFVSTNGSQNVRLKIEYATVSNPSNYITYRENIVINGWTGWNVINMIDLPRFGGSSSSNVKYFRLTFTHTGVVDNYIGLRIYSIYGYGGVGWTTPSVMASYGVPYTYDEFGNIYIMNNLSAPNTITANTIVKRGSSNDYVLLGGGGTASLNSIDTKVTQTVTNSGNSSWCPLILGHSYNDDITFAPATVTNSVYASSLAKFKPNTGILAVVGLNKMNSNGTMSTGSDTDVFNTNGGTTDISIKADKVSGATNNHFAALDANGNIKDSGKASEDFALSSVYSTRSSNTVAVINVPVEEGAFSNGTVHTLTVVVLTTEQKAAVKSVTGIEFNYCDTSQSFTTPENIYSDSGLTTSVARILVCKNSSIDGLSGSFFNASAELTAGTYYGRRVRQSGARSHTEGNNCIAFGTNSHSEGNQASSTGSNSHSEGQAVIASGDNSHAEGVNTVASGERSHVEGTGTTASNTNSHAEGYYTTASGSRSHTEGANTTASGTNSHAEGDNTTANGANSHAEGYQSQSLSNYTHAEGYQTKAMGQYSHTEGRQTETYGQSNHSEGYGSLTTGIASHAEGTDTFAGYDSAHAEGNKSAAVGDSAHAEGGGVCLSAKTAKSGNVFTLVSGTWGDIEPSAGDMAVWFYSSNYRFSKVVSSTSNSITVENGGSYGGNRDIKVYMHAAIGDKSHVSGWNNIALQNYQTVIGTNALKDTNNDYAFIVGNGANAGARGNAFAVGWDGKTYRWVNGSPVECGLKGDDGTSAYWFTGNAVNGTGTGISATVSGSKAGDMYLNPNTQRVYIATAANTWDYVCNIKGEQGASGSIVSMAYRFVGDTNNPCALKAGTLSDSIAIQQADARITINDINPNNKYADVHLTYHCFASTLRWEGLMLELSLWRYNDWCGNIVGRIVSASGKTEVTLPKPAETNPAYGTIIVSHKSTGVGGSESNVHLVIDMHLILAYDVDYAELFTDGHYFELEMK